MTKIKNIKVGDIIRIKKNINTYVDSYHDFIRLHGTDLIICEVHSNIHLGVTVIPLDGSTLFDIYYHEIDQVIET